MTSLMLKETDFHVSISMIERKHLSDLFKHDSDSKIRKKVFGF